MPLLQSRPQYTRFHTRGRAERCKGTAHVLDLREPDAAVLGVLGHPGEARVRVCEVEVVHLGLALPPVLPQVAALHDRGLTIISRPTLSLSPTDTCEPDTLVRVHVRCVWC